MKTRNEIIVDGRFLLLKQANGKVNEKNFGVIFDSERGTNSSYLTFRSNVPLPEELKHRDKIHVEGHVEAYQTRNADNRIVTNYTFYADSIEKQRSELEQAFGIPGASYVQDQVRCFFLGTVTRILPTSEKSDWIRFLLLVDEDNPHRFASTSPIDLYNRRRQESLAVGDIVFVVTYVTTPRKEINGEQVSFKNFVATDLRKLSDLKPSIETAQETASVQKTEIELNAKPEENSDQQTESHPETELESEETMGITFPSSSTTSFSF